MNISTVPGRVLPKCKHLNLSTYILIIFEIVLCQVTSIGRLRFIIISDYTCIYLKELKNPIRFD